MLKIQYMYTHYRQGKGQGKDKGKYIIAKLILKLNWILKAIFFPISLAYTSFRWSKVSWIS